MFHFPYHSEGGEGHSVKFIQYTFLYQIIFKSFNVFNLLQESSDESTCPIKRRRANTNVLRVPVVVAVSSRLPDKPSSKVPGSVVSSVPIPSEEEPTASSNVPVPGPSGDENTRQKKVQNCL